MDPETDRVRVTVLGGMRRPLLLDRFFEIVPLDARYPGALRQSPIGEAVFPEGDDVLRGPRAPQPGAHVILNNAGRRLDQALESEEFARVLQEVLRRQANADRAGG